MNLYSHQKTQKLEEERMNARLAIEATIGQPRRRSLTLRIEAGREEQFRHLRRSLLASEQVAWLIAATEPPHEPQRATAPHVATAATARVQFALPRTSRRRPLGSAARSVGQALRRMGEGLEAWASPPQAERDGEPLSFDQR